MIRSKILVYPYLGTTERELASVNQWFALFKRSSLTLRTGSHLTHEASVRVHSTSLDDRSLLVSIEKESNCLRKGFGIEVQLSASSTVLYLN